MPGARHRGARRRRPANGRSSCVMPRALLVLFTLQRYFVRGLTAGAVKG
jgi:hypothetical protein